MKNLLRSREEESGCTVLVDYGERTKFVYFSMQRDDGDNSDCVILDEGEMDKVVAAWTAMRRTMAEVA